MVPRRGIALLSVLLAIYGISVAYRSFSARGLETANAPISASDLVFDPPRDLGWVRANPTVPVERSPFRFTEIARSAGIDFVHFSGMTEDKHFPTANGSGVAIFDYDDDGKLDLYFATGTLLPLGTAPTGPNRLYRNLGKGRFEDVTEHSGLGFAGYCHGIVVGDIDNDGDQDVFLCNYGPNVLFLNNGDGTFSDISKAAGIDRPETGPPAGRSSTTTTMATSTSTWPITATGRSPTTSSSAADRRRRACPARSRSTSTARPERSTRPGTSSTGTTATGTFTDVTEPAGVGRTDGRGFGVVAADLNGDGRIDLYVANDMCPNFVFLNRGDGTFEDVTEILGCRLRRRRPASVRGWASMPRTSTATAGPTCSSPITSTSPTPCSSNLGGGPIRGPDPLLAA